MNNDDIHLVGVSELVLDRKNPRLPEFGLNAKTPEEDVIGILWDAMDVNELALSIAASGFFPHEPLIVAKEEGQSVVIEGNRRLAAVKLLLSPKLATAVGAAVPKLTKMVRDELRELPVIVAKRKDSWRYLGFKHVNGPAKWSSYAKSRYIAEVHRDYSATLEEIASQIGDTHRTVQRLYRGLMVVEQAERMKVFDREDRWRKHFSFSHLYTGLEYPGISSFLELSSESVETDAPVPETRIDELGELLIWLYGSRQDDNPPVVESQNPHLRQLDSVVRSTEAIAALREGSGLAISFELSRPATTVFEEALLASKRHLQKARSLLSTGYSGSEKLLGIADDVWSLAEDLYSEMERKRTSRRRSRKMEER